MVKYAWGDDGWRKRESQELHKETLWAKRGDMKLKETIHAGHT